MAHGTPSNASLGQGTSSSTLKIIAIVGMTANHGAWIFAPFLPFPALCVLLACGGVTFPIMAFLLIEGYRHTSSFGRYAARLFAFALISQVPYSLFLSSNLNVLFTLLIGLGLLYIHDHGLPSIRLRKQEGGATPLERSGKMVRFRQSSITFWCIAVIGVAVSSLCDWGVLGPLMILMGYLMPTRTQRIVCPLALAVLSIGLPQAGELLTGSGMDALPYLLYAFVGCTSAAPLLFSYKGARGLPMKYFFYAYYPLHILILGLLRSALFGTASA